MSNRAAMIVAAPTGTVASDRTLPPVARKLWWLPGSRLSNGEAMPDRAALIEAQIPGLRRFACALLRGDREAADDLPVVIRDAVLLRFADAFLPYAGVDMLSRPE